MSDLIHAQHDDYDKLDLLLCYGYDIHIKGKQVPVANASQELFCVLFCFATHVFLSTDWFSSLN